MGCGTSQPEDTTLFEQSQPLLTKYKHFAGGLKLSASILPKCLSAWKRFITIVHFEREEREKINAKIKDSVVGSTAVQDAGFTRTFHKRRLGKGSDQAAPTVTKRILHVHQEGANKEVERINTIIQEKQMKANARKERMTGKPVVPRMNCHPWPTMAMLRSAGLISPRYVQLVRMQLHSETTCHARSMPCMRRLCTARIRVRVRTCVRLCVRTCCAFSRIHGVDRMCHIFVPTERGVVMPARALAG